MLTKIPNVDRKKMPELAQFVEQCMMRYEYRLDGSSLWEGRVLAPPHCHETIQQMPRISNGIASRLRWCERMRSYPQFRVPAGFDLVKMWSAAGIGYYRHDRCRAVLALQDIDLFLIHHPDEAGYQSLTIRATRRN